MKKKTRRSAPEVNAGSMADIAFLLLIFFLVTTTIAADKGILVKLSPWVDEPPVTDIKDRNALRVHINYQGELMVEDVETEIDEFRDLIKDFVENPERKEHLSERPTKAVVSLNHDRNTTYDVYLSVYNELKAAYREMWETESLRRYGKHYSKIGKSQQRAVRNLFPQVISEAEPSDFLK